MAGLRGFCHIRIKPGIILVHLPPGHKLTEHAMSHTSDNPVSMEERSISNY